MIGRRKLAPEYLEWNRRWGAPYGHRASATRLRFSRLVRKVSKLHADRLLGPFAFQSNSYTRTWEYPWAYFNGMISPGLKVLDVGGGYSGFAFVLAKEGCDVAVVDPGGDIEHISWKMSRDKFAYLNRAHRTIVKLEAVRLGQLTVPLRSIDRIFCISVIEHVPDEEAQDIIRSAYGLLCPGGKMILTVDLFLHLQPFTDRETCKYGRNLAVTELLGAEPRFKMVAGVHAELFGFPSFDPKQILQRLDEFLIAHHYPGVAQCFVLERPS